MTYKKASGIMAVYNRKEYVAKAIESTINQTYPNIELIIVDDASTDGSHLICQDYSKKYPQIIKYIRLNENKGAGNAFHIGTSHSTGKYITFIGSDDILHPNRFSISIDILEKEKNIDMVFCNYETIDGEDKKTGRRLFIPPEINNNNILNYELRRNYLYSVLCFMRNTPDIQYDPTLKCAVDYDLFLNLIMKGYRIKFIDDILCYYRIHDNNISANYKNSNEAVRYILNKYSTDDLYSQLKQRGINDKTIFNTLGIIEITKERYNSAIDYLNKAQFIENNNIQDCLDNYFYLATALYSIGKLVKVKEYLLKAHNIANNDATILNNLGVIEYQLHNYNKAKKYFIDSLSLQPLYRDAKTNLDCLIKNQEVNKYTLKYLRKNVIHAQNAVF